jgi:hypothetical protein
MQKKGNNTKGKKGRGSWKNKKSSGYGRKD